MVICIDTYRARIGAHDIHRLGWKERRGPKNGKSISVVSLIVPYWVLALYTIYREDRTKLIHKVDYPKLSPFKMSRVSLLSAILLFFVNILALSGDIEPNPGPTNKGMSIFFLNAQSIKGTTRYQTKLIDFKNMIYTLQPDVFAVCETWLTEQVPDESVISEDYYKLYRKDRTDTTGGGVALLVKNDIWSKRRKEVESKYSKFNEIIAVEIKPDLNRKIMVIVCYRSQAHKSEDFLPNLEVVLENCCLSGYRDFILLGDFNYRKIDWSKNQAKLPQECNNFKHILDMYNLRQINFHPSTIAGNTLDLLCLNLPEETSEVILHRYPYKSDHYMLDFQIDLNIKRKLDIPRTVYNFKKGNMGALKNEIHLNDMIPANVASHGINASWIHFKVKLLKLVNRHIPKVKIKNKNAPPWIDSDVVAASKNKEKAFLKAKKRQNSALWDRYKTLRNNLKNVVKQKYIEYIENLTSKLGSEPKRFWSFIRSISNPRGSVPDIVHDGKSFSDNTTKANVFNTYFQSVFNNRKLTLPQTVYPKADPGLCEVNVETTEVEAILKNLDPTKAQGPDGIPTRVLKECSNELAPPVTKIINQSLNENTVPDEWKMANVVPIFKKGDKSSVKNYRPVSLLPILSKVMERCVYNKIINIVMPKLTKVQHGFLKGRSTIGQLLTVFSNINAILERKSPADVIYFDLSKAFDSVPHNGLLHKLRAFGVGGQLIKWLESYLANRLQRVVLGGDSSEWLTVSSGVPQGSILGPLLFLIYINDLPDILHHDTICAIFADDTKIYRAINSEADRNLLQNDVNAISQWGHSWGLTFNPKKCQYITIGKVNPLITEANYSMQGTVLDSADNIKDLGILVDCELKWEIHINSLIKSANSKLWLMIRNLGFQAPYQTKKMVYITLIRSKIEYGCALWNPHFKYLIEDLEGVQRRASNYILSNPRRPSPLHVEYKNRLLQLNLLPLSYRREIIDITFFLKSYHGKTEFDVKKYLKFSDENPTRTTRCATMGNSLIVKNKSKNTDEHFFSSRVARIWNALPADMRNSLKTVHESLIVKQTLNPLYYYLLEFFFDSNNTCTWTNCCPCGRCRLS
jgi:hypothetical protein